MTVKSFIVEAPREPYLLKRSFLSLVLHTLKNNIKLYSTILINKNTLACDIKELITAIKSFIVQAPREPYLLKRSFLSLVLHTLKNIIKLYSTILNTLAYDIKESATGVKNFTVQTPREP